MGPWGVITFLFIESFPCWRHSKGAAHAASPLNSHSFMQVDSPVPAPEVRGTTKWRSFLTGKSTVFSLWSLIVEINRLCALPITADKRRENQNLGRSLPKLTTGISEWFHQPFISEVTLEQWWGACSSLYYWMLRKVRHHWGCDNKDLRMGNGFTSPHSSRQGPKGSPVQGSVLRSAVRMGAVQAGGSVHTDQKCCFGFCHVFTRLNLIVVANCPNYPCRSLFLGMPNPLRDLHCILFPVLKTSRFLKKWTEQPPPQWQTTKITKTSLREHEHWQKEKHHHCFPLSLCDPSRGLRG